MKTRPFLAVLACALVALAASTPAAAQIQSITPPRIERTVEPVFPAGLLQAHSKGGHARLVLEIAASGALEDALVIGYSAKGFAEEALWAARRWRYQPALLRNEPIASQWELLVSFEPTGAMVSMIALDSTNELIRTGYGPDDVYRPRRFDELDRPLTPTHVVQPAYTKNVQDRGLKGEVTVEFYVDEQGNVRMPALQESDHNVLGTLAGAAVREWKFEPPTVRGRPVLVKARQTFRFTPEAPGVRQQAGQ